MAPAKSITPAKTHVDWLIEQNPILYWNDSCLIASKIVRVQKENAATGLCLATALPTKSICSFAFKRFQMQHKWYE